MSQPRRRFSFSSCAFGHRSIHRDRASKLVSAASAAAVKPEKLDSPQPLLTRISPGVLANGTCGGSPVDDNRDIRRRVVSAAAAAGPNLANPARLAGKFRAANRLI